MTTRWQAPLIVALSLLVWAASGFAGATAGQPPATPGAGRGGSAQDPCGGRSAQPRVPCANDVAKMMAVLPARAPATPKQAR